MYSFPVFSEERLWCWETGPLQNARTPDTCEDCVPSSCVLVLSLLETSWSLKFNGKKQKAAPKWRLLVLLYLLFRL